MSYAWKSIDFAAINAVCLSQSHSLLRRWLPGGQQRGREWYALNPTRADRRLGSFSVNLDSGRWGDFATGDGGGDLVSLYAYLNRIGQADAARALRQDMGLAA